jgi:DNA-binding HxlR family transcriptional regulator
VRRTRFDDALCPIARTTDLLGDWWTPLVLREAAFGVTRFDQFQERLEISRATLTQRLARLVDEGILERERYEEHPPRFEYRLTQKGVELFDVLLAMWRWGEDWLFPDDPPPLRLTDRRTGADLRPVVVDEHSGRRVGIAHTRVRRRASDRAAR